MEKKDGYLYYSYSGGKFTLEGENEGFRILYHEEFTDIDGTLLGIAQMVCLIWALFILFGYFDILHLNGWILEMVNQSRLLGLLYHTNYIIRLMQVM